MPLTALALLLTPVPASDFTDRTGVNTHLDFPGVYSNLAMVGTDVNFLGVHHIRDFPNSQRDIGTLGLWQQVANATGAKFDAALPEGSATVMKFDAGYLPQLARQGILEYVEGGNEEDQPFATGLGNSLTITAAYQPTVYALAHQIDLAAINMSFGTGWSSPTGDYGTVGNLTASCDYANAHTYPGTGNPPGSTIVALNADAQLSCKKPVITTEFGYYTTGSKTDPTSLSEATQAKYVLAGLFDAYKAGDVRTYLYELLDQGTEDGDTEDNFGLFRSDGSPKLAATALHNLMTLLADTKVAATKPLSLTLSGLQPTDNYLLLEKSSGVYLLAIWPEVRLSGPDVPVDIAYPGRQVTIEVNGQVAEFDPTKGTEPIFTGPVINLIDHLVLVRIQP
jgi:hypothetical protein